MRSYIGLLVFENIFNYVPEGIPDLTNLANTIFTPNVLVVENNCGTTLGRFEVINFESQGIVELATGDFLTPERIGQLLSSGTYEIATRHTSSCISKGGVCAKCYNSTFPSEPMPKVLDRVTFKPEFLINSEVITVEAGSTSYNIVTNAELFSKVYVWVDGVLQTLGVDYTIEGAVITPTIPIAEKIDIVVRCVEFDTRPYLSWLANTYSGSILGMKSTSNPRLPVRTLLLSSMLSQNRLQLVSELVKDIPSMPSDYAEYADSIKDTLEKGLYLLALYCIYSNVSL
jgi:hypothetical protein